MANEKKTMNAAQLSSEVRALYEKIPELENALTVIEKRIEDLEKESTGESTAEIPEPTVELLKLQTRQRASTGVGPAMRMGCKNCGNSWLHELTLKRFSSDAPHPPNVACHAIGATAGRVGEFHVLQCPVCKSIIVPYDPFADLIDEREWTAFIDEIREAFKKVGGQEGTVANQRPESISNRSGSGLISNDMEIY